MIASKDGVPFREMLTGGRFYYGADNHAQRRGRLLGKAGREGVGAGGGGMERGHGGWSGS